MAARARTARKSTKRPDPPQRSQLARDLEHARVAMLAGRDRVAAAALQWAAATATRRCVRARAEALAEAVRFYSSACAAYDRAFADMYGQHLALRRPLSAA